MNAPPDQPRDCTSPAGPTVQQRAGVWPPAFAERIPIPQQSGVWEAVQFHLAIVVLVAIGPGMGLVVIRWFESGPLASVPFEGGPSGAAIAFIVAFASLLWTAPQAVRLIWRRFCERYDWIDGDFRCDFGYATMRIPPQMFAGIERRSYRVYPAVVPQAGVLIRLSQPAAWRETRGGGWQWFRAPVELPGSTVLPDEQAPFLFFSPKDPQSFMDEAATRARQLRWQEDRLVLKEADGALVDGAQTPQEGAAAGAE